MSNTNQHSRPALRIEAVSINCILTQSFTTATKRNLLIIAESLTAELYYVLLYYKMIFLILYICRNAQKATGNFTLVYGDVNHKHAVTAVTSPSTGTFNYSYDEAGNMISHYVAPLGSDIEFTEVIR